MKKRIRSIKQLLALALSVVMIGTSGISAVAVENVNADTTVKAAAVNESDFQVNDSGAITGYKGSETDIVIPSEVNGVKVTAVANGAFEDLAGTSPITSVVLPEGVVSIGDMAFSQCKNLKSVTFPSTLKTIGNNPFAGCNAGYEIYFAGTKEEWEARTIEGKGKWNPTPLKVHYESTVVKPEPAEFVITFDAKKGTVDPKQTKTINSKLESLPVPFKQGAKFMGWFLDEAATQEVTSETVFTADTTIYAKWKKTGGGDQGSGEVKLDGPKEDSYAGTGTVADPYRLLIYKISGQGAPATRPSAFWAAMKDDSKDVNVVFEGTADNTTTGKLLYSYTFNKKDMVRNHWIVPGQEDEWVHAFKLSPYTEFKNDNGTLKFAHAWKGNYKWFFNNFEYKLNVAAVTNKKIYKFNENEKIKPGDKVKVTHYGNYDATETSRAGNFNIRFNETENVGPGETVYPAYEPWSVELVVDADGFITFSGENMITQGGNFVVEKVVEEVKPDGDKEEVKPVDPTDKNENVKQEADTKPAKKPNKNTIPKTGDTTNPFVPMTTMVLALAAVVFAKRRYNK